MVLRSLEDDENKMRILAQLHLNSALSWDEEFTWDLTLRYSTLVDSYQKPFIFLLNYSLKNCTVSSIIHYIAVAVPA